MLYFIVICASFYLDFRLFKVRSLRSRFGVNLLDSVARRNRPIREKEAYELSDKLIRSNCFGGCNI